MQVNSPFVKHFLCNFRKFALLSLKSNLGCERLSRVLRRLTKRNNGCVLTSNLNIANVFNDHFVIVGRACQGSRQYVVSLIPDPHHKACICVK